MKRLSALLLFLLLASLLAPSGAVKAETSYYGLSFDGVDDYVQTNITASQFQSVTVIAIVKVHGDTGSYQFFIGGDYSHGFALGYRDSIGYRFYVATSNNGSLVTFGAGKDRSTRFIAGVYDADSQLARVYLDGVKEKEVSVNTSFTSTNAVRVGSEYNGYYMANATIYLVLIYSRALSDSEIQAIYNDPLNPPQDGLVLFYAPDSVDTATNTWHDKSGNGNDGSIVGATYVPLRPVEESEPSKDAPVALDYVTGVKQGAIIQNVPLGNDGTILFIGRVNAPMKGNLLDTRTGWFGAGGTGVTIRDLAGAGKYDFLIANGSVVTFVKRYVNLTDNRVHVIGMVWTSTSASAIVDTNIYTATVSLSDTFTNGVIYIGSGWEGGTNSTIYLVLIYSRALSDEEIRQIYENPENPPLDGLVLWFDPYSYDPASGRWLNRAPIFPTIPLAEELDGTNYGATSERVSIPKLSVYDAQNSSEIPVENVSVALIENNTTISLLPSFLTLPYNSTVMLNVSAVNYKARILNVTTPLEYIAAYLNPQPGEESLPDLFNYRIFNLTQVNFSNVTLEDYTKLFEHWPGGGLLKGLWEMNLTEFLHDVFAFDVSVEGRSFAWVGVLLVALIWFGGSLVAWFRFKDPIPTLAFSRVLYEGLGYFSPPAFTVLRAPVAAFMLYMGYLLIKNLLAKWSGER